MKKHFIILSVYIIIALVMSLPLALNFSSAIPGVEGDAPSYVWALGWAKRALELNADLFHTDFIFYPLGGATQLLWSVALIAFLSLPLQYAFDLIVAHNVMWLAATVMSGYGMFLLAESVIANGEIGIAKKQSGVSQLAIRNSQFASFTAGLVFAFAPLRLGYGLAFLNLFNTQFIPFYLLFLFRAARASKTSLRASESERSNRRAAITSPLTNNQRRDIFLAGLFLGVNAYIDFQIAAFLGLFSALYAFYEFIALATLWRARANGRANYFALARTLAAIALTALVIAAPMLGIIASDFAIEGGDYIRVFKMEYSAARSYDLAMFFIPSARSTLYANVPIKIPGVNAGQTVDDVGPLSPDR
ncbi:MAG: hypothetical protein HY070_02975, partial [Chloroflexi bacterium]|nr:hypothetical protein [Chloroflexota bacterium]